MDMPSAENGLVAYSGVTIKRQRSPMTQGQIIESFKDDEM